MSDRESAFAPVLDDGVVWPEDAIEVGRIVDAWGVKGGIKVQPFSSDPQALFCTKKWFVRPAEQASGALPRPSAAVAGTSLANTAAVKSSPAGRAKATGPGPAPALPRLAKPRFLQVIQAREQGDIVVATAEGLEDRNDAEALRGARVYVSRSAFPTPDENEFYWIDLIGLDVVNPEGVALGKVADLIETGPNCVLRCVVDAAGDQDAVERLIPFVGAYIVSVSLPDRRIVADWGLDY